jgi:hypothetical protein
MTARGGTGTFYGWRVVTAAFVLAVFGWGLGFYGPPVYLHAVRETRGWSLTLVSTAVTVHFLFGALVVANLPRLYRRFGVPAVTKAGAISLAFGIFGWAVAHEPWQLFAATLLSGAGWVTMGAAAVNAIVSPWFVRTRHAALSSAYNGSSIGGVIFSPLWVAAIDQLGFPLAAATIGVVMIVTIWDFRFITLACGMALGLFAQIGLIAHLFSVLVPALGAQLAGAAAGVATAAAIAGRTMVGRLMPIGADRRFVACANNGVQILGSLAFFWAAGDNLPLLLLGIVLFGAGIGNTTSLPPLIAQVEFTKEDVPRVVPLIIAIGQATYAFAPAAFGLIRQLAPNVGAASAGASPYLFIAAMVIDALAIIAFLAGRQHSKQAAQASAA